MILQSLIAKKIVMKVVRKAGNSVGLNPRTTNAIARTVGIGTAITVAGLTWDPKGGAISLGEELFNRTIDKTF